MQTSRDGPLQESTHPQPSYPGPLPLPALRPQDANSSSQAFAWALSPGWRAVPGPPGRSSVYYKINQKGKISDFLGHLGTFPGRVTTFELGCIAIGQIEKLKLREGPPLPGVMQLVRD